VSLKQMKDPLGIGASPFPRSGEPPGGEEKPYPVEQVYPSDFVGPLPRGSTRDKNVTEKSEALDVHDYLQLVGKVEQYYRDQAKESGVPYDSNQAVSGMRAIYGYEGGKWEDMIPGAPQMRPPCDVPGGGDGNAQSGADCDAMQGVVDQMFTMT
jgi:hypothetical protein